MDQQSTKLRRGLLYRVACFCPLCVAIGTLNILFLLTLLLYQFGLPLGLENNSIASYISLLFISVFVPVIKFLADFLLSLSPWGVIAIIVILIVVCGPNWIGERLFSSNFELLGFKFIGQERQARFGKELGDVARAILKLNRELPEAYDSAKYFITELKQYKQIESAASDFARFVAQAVADKCPADFRLTVFIPDIIFADRLYQLTDYYGADGNKNKEGAGRSFSIRYGIIGRVWRSGVNEIEGDLISNEDRSEMKRQDADIEQYIARRWGIDLVEARHIKEYNSYGALRIEVAGRLLGIVYFDSKDSRAFGDREKMDELAEKISAELKISKIADVLLSLSEQTSAWTRVAVHKNR